MEENFIEIKAENIALVTASLPDCAKQTGLSNADISKIFSKITAIIEYYLYEILQPFHCTRIRVEMKFVTKNI